MNARVIEAMMLVIRWQQMREECFTRRTDGCCGDCPFDLGKACDAASTDYVLEESAKVFKRYIEETKEKENGN